MSEAQICHVYILFLFFFLFIHVEGKFLDKRKLKYVEM